MTTQNSAVTVSGTLPGHPSLEHLKNQAKSLLKHYRSSDPNSLILFSRYLSNKSEPVLLADAQFVIAREHGFPSWPKLKAYVESISGENTGRMRVTESNLKFFQDRADGLLSQHQSGLLLAGEQIAHSHPSFKDNAPEKVLVSAFTLDDALLVTAREHGFASWRELRRHLKGIVAGDNVEPFKVAFDAMKAGNMPLFDQLLRRDGSLISARGTNGNTLLNLAVGTSNIAAAKLLIELGAPVDIANVRGWTPLHSAAYGNRVELIEMLLGGGAKATASALGDGGTPLMMALFWGHRKAADLLVKSCGVLPLNLRAASGAGRVDLMATLFDAGGKLLPLAAEHRAFYRPHSGFCVWHPSDDPQEVLDEALVYAARNLRIDTMAFLLDHGACINSDPYNGSALHWVAGRGGGPEKNFASNLPLQLEVAQWLLDHGADINLRARYGGPTYGQALTPLHIAADSGNLAMVKFLVERGANPTLREEMYDAAPARRASYFGHTEVEEFLRQAAKDS